MSDNPIRLEAGTRHYLAYCTDCPSWRRLEATKPAALLTAARHLDAVHGDNRRARRFRARAVAGNTRLSGKRPTGPDTPNLD